jgi:hypothetical protein
MRKVTTPVPVEGGVAGGALPMSAGTSFHGRRNARLGRIPDPVQASLEGSRLPVTPLPTRSPITPSLAQFQ